MLGENGFQIFENIYSESEIDRIVSIIEMSSKVKQFGLRSFLKNNTTLIPLVFNKKLKELIAQYASKAFLVKSIFFDKPPNANWVVNWHQDLSINVDRKMAIDGFKNWRVLADRTVV